MAEKQNRCWPGYTPVPGKKANEQGSCRPKANSKLTANEQKFKEKRRRQLDKWEEEHPGKSRSVARHLRSPAKSKSKTKSVRSK